MTARRPPGGRFEGLTPKFVMLAIAQVAAVAFGAAAAVWPDGWPRMLALPALLAGIGALGIGAVVFTAARHLVRSQEALRDEVAAFAELRLPEILRDVVESRDLGQVRERLPAVSEAGLVLVNEGLEQACADVLRMAADRDEIRSGYSEVFVNMFRRTQSLLQRQLQIIERLERGDRSRSDLHLLFQLDHLVTRMRRNNENVLILSGTELVRATKGPISITDLFRAAISEVDKYQRIRVLEMPSVRVSNTAAGDLIRIIAELLDNATSFSAPDKEVTMNAELGRHHGLSIGVFDTGIGMSDEDIRNANDQLKRLGSAEIARSRRAGLFVVGRLAGQHGIKVELFSGDDGEGVSALISVPSSLLQEEDVVRAALPGDSRVAGTAVPVTTSVRRPAAPLVAATENRQVSSWHSRAKAWTKEREDVRKRIESTRAERIRADHADVPEELPIRVPNPHVGNPPGKRAEVEAPVVKVPEGGVPAGNVSEEPQGPTSAEPDTGEPDRVAGAWFRARDKARDPHPLSAPPAGLDPMRQIAESRTSPREYTYTEDGLPLRQAGAHLVPGMADSAPTPDRSVEIKPFERDPKKMQRRLSSYQLGVEKAKEREDRMRGRQHTGGWTVLERKTK